MNLDEYARLQSVPWMHLQFGCDRGHNGVQRKMDQRTEGGFDDGQ